MNTKDGGFTIIEVVVAVLLLTVGVLGLASTSGAVKRMIGQCKRFTQVGVLASERMDILRGLPCDSLTDGSENRGRFQVTWQITSMASGEGRNLQVRVTSPTATGTRLDVFSTTLSCRR